MEELEQLPKELMGNATLQVEQQYELTSTPELLTLAVYVSKDGLVGHHWKIKIHKPHETQVEGRPKCDTQVLLRRENKLPMEGVLETNCGTESE